MDTRALQLEFETFLARVQARLLAYARMLLRDEDLAGDACQETLLAMYRKLEEGGVIGEWEGYLFVALRHQCMKLRRRERSERRMELNDLYASSVKEEQGDFERVLRYLDELDEKQQEVIALKFFDGFTLQQISAITGEPVTTLASRCKTALDTLRQKCAKGSR